MRRFTPILVLIFLGASPAASPSRVTLQILRTGCLALSGSAHLKVQVFGKAGMAQMQPVAYRTISPPVSVPLRLAPGYYEMSVSSRRCWMTHQPFVVGSAWNRTLTAEPGFTIFPPRRNVQSMPPPVDPRPMSGVVLHADPSVTKVRMKYDGGTDPLLQSANVWFLDDAHVGPVQIRLYAGGRLVRKDDVVLQPDGFLEKFYTHD